MKKKVFVFLVSLIVISFASAQDKVNTKTGKIYFLRSTGLVGFAAPFKTYIDGELVCKLDNKKYSIHEVSSGNHECYVIFGGLKLNEKAEKCNVKVESDKITYVQFFLENGFLSFRIYGEEITEDTAKEKMKKMKEDTKCL
jgi:hypothetical protein